jgi:tetratricopeptide (TPR) repeat protein
MTARLTSTATNTLIPSETPIIAVPYIPPHTFATPGPIETPSEKAATFHLKPWNEQYAADLIRQMEQYAYDSDEPGPGETRFSFQGALLPLKLALKEAIYRFPNSQTSQTNEWHLALTNAWLVNSETDDWLVKTLEDALNTGSYTPENLGKLVRQYGFDLHLLSPVQNPDAPIFSGCYSIWADSSNQSTHFVPAPNLFGDGRDAKVSWLTTQGWHGSDGLFFAFVQDDQGKYQAFLIHSAWNFLSGSYWGFCVGDHTQDGIPEVSIEIMRHSGSMCAGDLYIFQWQTDRFFDLSRGDMGLNECDSSFEYTPSKSGGPDAIQLNNWGYTNYFEWTGRWYEEIDETVPREFDYMIERYIYKGDFYTATLSIQQKLSTWSVDDAKEYGDSYPDFLHFQLGMIYALQSDQTDAKAEFQHLVDAPTNPQVITISQAASAFLEKYQSDKDAYISCLSALDVMKKAIIPYREENGYIPGDAFRNTWGYERSYGGGAPTLCNPDTFFPLLVSTFSLEETTDAPAALRKAGVDVAYSAYLDVDGNQIKDWIEVIINPYAVDGHEVSLWVLLQKGETLIPLPFFDYFDVYHDPDKKSALNIFRVETRVFPNNPVPVIFMQSGDVLYVFRVEQRHGQPKIILLNKPLSWGSVSKYTIQDDADILAYQVFYADEFTPAWKIYQWDEAIERFMAVEIYNNAAQNPQDSFRQAELKLFVEQKPLEAIPLFKNLLASDSEQNSYCPPMYLGAYCFIPRSSYLLALAYELTGDEAAAVQTYWQLWQDFPHSPYALMARAKLEPLKH